MQLKTRSVWDRWASPLPIKYHNSFFYIGRDKTLANYGYKRAVTKLINNLEFPDNYETDVDEDPWLTDMWVDEDMVVYKRFRKGVWNNENKAIYGNLILGSEISKPLIQAIRFVRGWGLAVNYRLPINPCVSDLAIAIEQDTDKVFYLLPNYGGWPIDGWVEEMEPLSPERRLGHPPRGFIFS